MIFECAAEGNDEGEAIVNCVKDNDDCQMMLVDKKNTNFSN